MAGKKSSKTARASMRAGSRPGQGFLRSPFTSRFIPTGGGRFTYVMLPDGKTAHVKVGSGEFVAALQALDAADDQRFRADIAAFDAQFPGCGWGTAFDLPSDEHEAEAA